MTAGAPQQVIWCHTLKGGSNMDRNRVLGLLTSQSLELRRRRSLLLDLLSDLDTSFVGSLSREQGSHFKWYLGALSGGRRGRIWLHEFKAQPHEGAGYARSIHNHRYDLDVWIVSGGYLHEKFALPLDQDYFDEAEIARGLTESSFLGPGTYYSLGHTEFHALSRIEPGTFTVVAEHTPSKHASMSLNRTGGRWLVHRPVDTRFLEMRGIVEHLLTSDSYQHMQLDGEQR